MMMVGPFTARFGKVWHGARRVDYPDGTVGLSLGFVVAEVNHDIEARDAAARQLAAAMNLIQRLDGLDQAARDAERLIADMSRHLPDMALPDYALLNEAPIALRRMLAWLAETRTTMAGPGQGAATEPLDAA